MHFDHVALHPQAWIRNTPQSSMPSHLFLCAVRLPDSRIASSALLPRAAWAVREVFFKEGADISRLEVLLALAGRIGIPVAEIENILGSGAAHAALSEDLDLARNQSVQASPTLLSNESRQRLTGNVGYRIIEADIRELIEGAPGQLSWC